MKNAILGLLLMLFAQLSVAQDAADPVKWSVSVEDDMIISKATIDEGWVIYATNTPSGGPIPTSFMYSDNVITDGETIQVDKPIKKYDNLFEMDVLKHSTSAQFTQKYKNTGSESASVTIRYMSCNNESCLPPKSVTFDVNL